ncbi:MAG TPA: NAD(P)H-dependent oxidoreductase [Candidatus Omnitrophota bacterium]|nr:NAD(P)H-dependent oxidoreductase [Candidatus Omnitrophota bacterium]HPS20644.1 NAD(P)H-dependent oxidoreductase [Candidatus Omnitrophota bacterium]
MVVSVILAHPEKGSFNHAIAETVVKTIKENGHKVLFHDLYKERFDAALPAKEIKKNAAVDKNIKKYCEELTRSNGVIIVHPNWWGQPPAILKGWMDRVIRPGVAYEFKTGDNGEGIPVGLLVGKRVMVFNTANTPKDREARVFGDPLENLWKTCIMDLCGVKIFYRKMFSVIVTSSPKERKTWLKEVSEDAGRYFPEQIK